MSARVAIVRDRFVTRSELDNYSDIEDYDITIIGSKGYEYDGDLQHETLVSPSSAPRPFRHPTQAISSLFFGSSTLMWNLVDKLKSFDIVHTVETLHGFSNQAIDAKHRHDCRVVCTVWENIPYFGESTHYSYTWRERVKHPNAQRIKNRVRNEVDLFLPVTEQAAESLRIEGVEDERIEVVPIGVDVERFRPNRLQESDRSPEEFGLKGGEVVDVVFVGRYTHSKGVYDLLSAWKRVERIATQPVHLTLIGGGDEQEQVEKFARYIGVTDVEIRGPIPYDDVPYVFDAADIAVLPSLPVKHWQEQYGRVILEAQASGTAVAASEVGGIPDALGGVGCLFQPGEPLSISETLLSLIRDESRRRALGVEGRKRIKECRTLAHTAARVSEVYDRVL